MYETGRLTHTEECLESVGLLVAKIEETVPRVVSVKAKFGAEVRLERTAAAQVERLVTAAAKLVPTLDAGEVHATPAGQQISKVAIRALYPVLFQLFFYQQFCPLHLVCFFHLCVAVLLAR
jgi:hypothetical protein